jgi:hypothetical protein
LKPALICFKGAGLNPIRYAQGQVLRNPAYEKLSSSRSEFDHSSKKRLTGKSDQPIPKTISQSTWCNGFLSVGWL